MNARNLVLLITGREDLVCDDEHVKAIDTAIREAGECGRREGMREEQERVSRWVRESFGDGAMHRQERPTQCPICEHIYGKWENYGG
jgi:rubrerythrin